MTDPGDDLTQETLMAVARARARAAGAPTADELAELLTGAGRHKGTMSADDIRELGATAIRQARQVSYLLGKLAGLVGDADGEADAG